MPSPSTAVMQATRSGRVECEHPVDVAVVGLDGALVGGAGDPGRRTYWRSAAKPFQAMPLIDSGAADRLGLSSKMLALACASHSSEPEHLAVAQQMLTLAGATEADLACGPHPSISPERRDELLRAHTALSPVFNNCSGKHAGMLLLAQHLKAPRAGYQDPGHPVQARILEVVQRLSGLPADAIEIGTDGCTAACFYLSLEGMARAWMHLGQDEAPAPERLRDAMWAHPWLVAGSGRACTAVLEAAPGRVLAKVGAEGLYCGAIRDAQRGVGIALKVRSGDGRMSPVALISVLRALDAQFGFQLPLSAWADFERPAVLDTRGRPVGHLQARPGLSLRL